MRSLVMMFKTIHDKVGALHLLIGACLAIGAHRLLDVRSSSDVWIVLGLLVLILIIAASPPSED